MYDKWNFSECFNFAEKCSVSIKVGLGPNGNSVNVQEEKFQYFAGLQYCAWAAIRGAVGQKSSFERHEASSPSPLSLA